MVGYVLGLGDRHPSNLLLDRSSGKILHIDFGDCFEVAMTREKFPEKIPFRLTRMLINAMEVTGIEGTYRSTCESTMEVLRRKGIFSGNFSLVIATSKQSPKSIWRIFPEFRSKRRLEGCLSPRPRTYPTIDITAKDLVKFVLLSNQTSLDGDFNKSNLAKSSP